jgi:hypothetical protein
LVEIIIPASVEVLDCGCFSACRSLSLITFERESQLREVARDAFMGLPVPPTLPTMKYCLEEIQYFESQYLTIVYCMIGESESELMI